MTDRDRIRRSVESALDGIPEDTLDVDRDVIAVTWPIASYKTSEGRTKIHHAFLPEYCTAKNLLDVAGYGRTGADGEVELSLNEFHCIGASGTSSVVYESPINVVATSRASTPVHLAATARITQSRDHVVITISSWDVSGNPAGRVPFYWRCLVPIAESPG